ncbi:hypothetical protein DZF91_25700 [Actinomadura logoneensis]|uniref:Uncharacterized protein n=1 Tax=Actinomadura logoneensis TaxID=2293572 RepID=A0A372JG28_9ACTN|nr:hypothetical protein [Actinomadura logoneensis]RFU38814.1 hypothetical protein DZF91_25700 [Actinomadura logoneensis]
MTDRPAIRWRPPVRRKPYLWFCLGRYFTFAAITAGAIVAGADLADGTDNPRAVLPFAVGYGGALVTCLVMLCAVALGFAGRSPSVPTTVAWLTWSLTLVAVLVAAVAVGRPAPALLVIACYPLVGAMPARRLAALPAR